MEYEGAPGAHKKKRAYAAQAYDFGAGANTIQQQQPPPLIPVAPAMMQPQEQLTAQFGQMNFGGQPQQPIPPQMQAAPQQMQPPPQHSVLNQLYPTDIISQPVQPFEIDGPPPPINLPPNTSVTPSPYANCDPKYVRSTAFDWDATTQKSVDRWQRPELNYSVVEFVAPQEYMVRPPQPLVYLFVFDVSYAAVANGLLATSARCIMESLDRIPNADSEANDPSMLVVSDLDEPFLPTPEDLLVNLSEARANIENFLEKMQSMFQDTQNGGSAMGSALRAGHKLISPVGGKITVLSASLPNLGVGKLEMREDKKLLGTSKEGSLLQTGNAFYKSFAVECSKNQVSIDMFLFSSQYQDVASLSNLPRYTGGQTYFYPGWNAARAEDAIKFAREFSDYLSAEIGLEAVLRVRATTGLRMSAFFGNFFNRSSDLCAFPAFPRDQAYVVEVAIDETITKPFCCLQTAVLHTTCNGERRIRVLTLALPTTENLANVYASADQQAITVYFSHKAVERALGSGLDAARDALQAKLIEILQTYKKELGEGIWAVIGLRKSSQIPSDLRAAALALLSTLPLPLMIQYIYPKFYSLHDMPDNAGVPDPQTGEIMLPPAMNLSSERIVPHGLYLIDDGVNQFLWVGRDAVPALLLDVFGIEDKNLLKQGKTLPPVVESDFNERIRAVIEKSRDHRAKGVGSIAAPSLYVIREDGEPSLKLWAQTLLVEDRADQGVSLHQWLGLLREKVSPEPPPLILSTWPD
ncbi:COPII subunit [Coniosporium tulheliwenetii]|uniref:COPII subunit n=1 Tax=Coniosporium tulheliwenetii TaxID=3383036 RepID=A0ACC2ZMA6_9PEZI|nr:COPII subunit [Cladosporium sp. JES 115]